MRATWPLFRQRTALAVVLCWLAAPGPGTARAKDDDAALRDKALKLNDVTGQEPMTGQILALMEDKANTKKLLAVALKLAREKEKDKNPPFNVNATYILGRTAAGLKLDDTALYFYRLHAQQALKLGSSTKFVRVIDQLYAIKKFTEAEKLCRDFLESEGDDNAKRYKVLVLRRLVLTQVKLGKVDDAMKVVNNLIKAQPENWLNVELKAQVLREVGKYDEAVKVYEDVLERVANDKRLDKEQKDDFTNDIRYTLSGVYVELKKIDKAEEQLRTLLSKDPSNPTYNNDLGFILADHDLKLDEAEALIRKALAEDKKQRKKATIKPAQDRDNAAYLDSLGWVLYKQKKYKEALPPMEQAVKQDEGQHIEIYDHLGDIYLALGEKAKAVAAWNKGLTCAPVSKRDEPRKLAVEKKIKQYGKSE